MRLSQAGCSFFLVAWLAHPSADALARDFADQKLGDGGYLYLAAGLIGATFNPWMIFYQSSALAEKRLSAAHYSAARWDTVVGAIVTQLLTATVLIAVGAAMTKAGSAAGLESVGQISDTLTPFLGETIGRAVFGLGVTGASLAAAIVCSLARMGLRRNFRPAALRRSRGNAKSLVRDRYSVCVLGSAIIVLLVRDIIWPSIAFIASRLSVSA